MKSSIPKPPQCPLSLQPIVDPVVAADGITYDREWIERHLATSNQSPVGHYTLPNKNLIINYSERRLTDPSLSQDQLDARAARDREREKRQPIQLHPMFNQNEADEINREAKLYPERYRRLMSYYDEYPFHLEHPLCAQELHCLLAWNFFEDLTKEQPEVSFVDVINKPLEIRRIIISKDFGAISHDVENYQMPLKKFLDLDAERMSAFLQASTSLTILLDKKDYKVTWDFIFSLSTEDYLKIEEWGLYGQEILFFSNPQHTDHLSLEELIAALKQSADVAVATFMDVEANKDKLFGRISAEDLSRIRTLASDGWKKLLTNEIPDPPGGIGATRIKPKTAADFESGMGRALGFLKGHALYYERTKADLPSLIHSLEDLKKVLKNLFPHQCKDVLETLRDRWGQLIKTPNDLAQLLNYFNLEREDLGLLMDFEEKDFYPNVPYLGKGEGHSIKYAFLPSGQATARYGAFIASDLPALTDEQWAKIEAGHVEAFELPPIFEALNQRGITFKNEHPMAVLEILDTKGSGERSFLQRLLPDQAHFEAALGALKPDRSTNYATGNKAGLQQQIDTLQDFLRHAMQPYLHLTPYQPPERPSPVLQPSTHSAAAGILRSLQVQEEIPQPRHWIHEQPRLTQSLLRTKLRSLSVDEFKQFFAEMDPADKETMVANCFSTLSDFTAFLSHSPLHPNSNDAHCQRCDLLYRTLHESINKKIHSIHDLFEVSQYLSEESKRNLYAQNDKKIIIDKWRKGYPQPKDQYLMLLRASFGYLGYKDHQTKHQPEASLVTQVAAYLLVLLCAFPIQLMPNWIAQPEINMLRFFGSQRATFVMGLEENYPHQSRLH